MSQQDNLYTLDQVKADKVNDYILQKYTDDSKPLYRRVKTEDELYREGMENWVGAMAMLWDAIGKPVDEKRLDVYCRQFKGVPFGLLEVGINYAMRNNTYQTIPAIGLIWEGIRKELIPLNLPPSTPVDEAIQEWCERKFKRIVYRFQLQNR